MTEYNSRKENSVKNQPDVLIFHTAIVSGQKQIAMMADEKSPTRISHRLFATSCSEMEINMTFLFTLLYIFAGRVRTWHRLSGMSAAAVISPMLITFLGMDPYMAVGIALSSDVLASAVSAFTYGKNKNLDIRNGLIMMIFVLIFTLVGSYVSSLVPGTAMGGFSTFMTLLLGIKFIVRPVMTTKSSMEHTDPKKKTYAIHAVRSDGRLYLRIHRSRRRYDDAADSDQRTWL